MLEKCQVESKVIEALLCMKKNFKMLKSSARDVQVQDYFIRLSHDDICQFQTLVTEDRVIAQKLSKFAIVLEGEQKYYKIPPIEREEKNFMTLLMRRPTNLKEVSSESDVCNA